MAKMKQFIYAPRTTTLALVEDSADGRTVAPLIAGIEAVWGLVGNNHGGSKREIHLTVKVRTHELEKVKERM
jgi:hypothetical protein